ncbi:MAG: hypothetical protein ACYTGX_15585 [Planctomycetota bacterium]|jgi:hypothetical protein
MANEITYSNIADQRTTNLLHTMLWDLGHDPTDLRQITEKVVRELDGSSAIKVPQLGRAYAMAAPGEQTGGSNTALTDASFTLTAARRVLKFNPSDVAQITSPAGNLLIDKLVELVLGSVGQTFTDMHTALYGSLSNSVGGGAAVDFSVDDFFDAIYQLHVSNARPYADGAFKAVLKHNSFNEFLNSLRSETGPIARREDVANIMGAGAPGFKGRFAGVDTFSSDSVAVATNANQNAMFGRYCFAYAEAPVAKVVSRIDRAVAAVEGGVVYVTVEYDGDVGDWDVIGNYWPSVAEAEDDEGVLISSDDA